MELKIEYLELDKLKPYEKNARKHQEADLSTIKAFLSPYTSSACCLSTLLLSPLHT